MAKAIYRTKLGRAYCGDSLEILKQIKPESIDLVITSPPFALQKKKTYGNVPPEQYISWFWPYAKMIAKVLKPKGSFVLDIGGSWKKGEPTRTLYHFELLISLCEEGGIFKLAQEFYWYNPAKIPAPAQWVTIDRIRVKDAVNPIWWLSKSSKPDANNRRVLKPYKKSMRRLLDKGYNYGRRPSGHVVSMKWDKDNKGAIPPNLIQASNTISYDNYLKGCRRFKLQPNPARFVEDVPEFFIKFLTEKNYIVLDPFAGSNVVGKVAEKLKRRWISIELNAEYAIGSSLRFDNVSETLIYEYILMRDKMANKKIIDNVWEKGNKIRGKNPEVWRKDIKGNKMRKGSYGTQGQFGWEIDHKKPTAMGGTNQERNLQPLHWEENRKKSDRYRKNSK